jgi:DNA-binding CsgD family transcriptional regulator
MENINGQTDSDPAVAGGHAEDEGANPLPWRRLRDVVTGVMGHLDPHRPREDGPRAEPEANRKSNEEGPRTSLERVNLTPRERDVLRLLAKDGPSNAEIASALGISIATVRLRLRSATRKLRLSTRTQAAVWFREIEDRGGHLSACKNDERHQRRHDDHDEKHGRDRREGDCRHGERAACNCDALADGHRSAPHPLDEEAQQRQDGDERGDHKGDVGDAAPPG